MAQVIYEREAPGYSRSRVGWGAIIAGVIAAMVVQAILTLLGMAIGFNVINPADPGFDYTRFGIGSGLWLLLSSLISGFAGGWVATSLANVTNRFDGLMHGLLTWGVFMIITAFLLGTGIGAVVGGTFNLASAVLTGSSQGVAQNIESPQEGVAMVQEQVEKMRGGQAAQPQQQTTGQARVEEAADRAAGITWGLFLTALLSLLASGFGGIAGLKRPSGSRATA